METSAAFEKCVKKTLGYEGGYSDNPADSGHKTMYGITEAEAKNHGWTGDMHGLTLDFAKSIYFKDYWLKNSCDKIAQINENVAFFVFDFGVNAGTGTSAMILQNALNSLNVGQQRPDLVVDGQIGQKTMDAFIYFGASSIPVILKMCEVLKGARYLDIVKNNYTQRVFIKGWLARTALQYVPQV